MPDTYSSQYREMVLAQIRSGRSEHPPVGRTPRIGGSPPNGGMLILRDTYGAAVSTGTIVAMVEEGAAMLDEFLAHITTRLQDSSVVHADETGLRVNAALAWVHSVSTTALTLYHLDPKRGTAAMDAMGVLEHLSGVLVHDGWVPYRHYTNVNHALCNAHHLRELDAAAATGTQAWANDMIGLLCDTWQQVCTAKTNGTSELGAGELECILTAYQTIIATGHRTNPPPAPTGKQGRPKRTKAANLLLRLDIHTSDVLRFATDFGVPFDNNLAERDSGWSKSTRKSLAASAAHKAPKHSSLCAATSPPPPNTASTNSKPSNNSSTATRGSPPPAPPPEPRTTQPDPDQIGT